MARVGVMVAVTVLVAVLTPEAQASVFSALSRGFETPEEAQFTSLSQTPDYEIKHYPEKKWVCTLQGTDEGQVTVFSRLFSYIDGSNGGNERLTMGIPVSIKVHKDRGVVVKQACFFIPERSQVNPPTPSDSLVFITTRPAMTVYSREFGGYALQESTWNGQIETLKRQLAADGNSVNASLAFWNAYDPPHTIWGRRNEVWLVEQ